MRLPTRFVGVLSPRSWSPAKRCTFRALDRAGRAEQEEVGRAGARTRGRGRPSRAWFAAVNTGGGGDTTAEPAKEPTKPEPTKPEPTKPEPTKPEPTDGGLGPFTDGLLVVRGSRMRLIELAQARNRDRGGDTRSARSITESSRVRELGHDAEGRLHFKMKRLTDHTRGANACTRAADSIAPARWLRPGPACVRRPSREYGWRRAARGCMFV